jgi:hypothetical protein
MFKPSLSKRTTVWVQADGDHNIFLKDLNMTKVTREGTIRTTFFIFFRLFFFYQCSASAFIALQNRKLIPPPGPQKKKKKIPLVRLRGQSLPGLNYQPHKTSFRWCQSAQGALLRSLRQRFLCLAGPNSQHQRHPGEPHRPDSEHEHGWEIHHEYRNVIMLGAQTRRSIPSQSQLEGIQDCPRQTARHRGDPAPVRPGSQAQQKVSGVLPI